MKATVRRWTLAVVLCALLLPSAGVGAQKSEKRPETIEIVNFLLGLDYSHWLVGPVYFIASEAERSEFLALSSDDQAEAFIEIFWKRRNSGLDIFGNDARREFEERAKQADTRYREGAVVGRRSDRGTIFVLYGEPASVEYDTSMKRNEPDLEVWVYPKDATEGLDGAKPKRRYWFAEKDGRTVLHTPRASRRTTTIERQG